MAMTFPLYKHLREVLEWDSITDRIRQFCSTRPGEHLVDAIEPLTEGESIRKRLKKISELKDLFIQGEMPDFSGMTDLRDILDLAGKEGILKLEEISRVRDFILASRRLRDFLVRNREYLPSWRDESRDINPCTALGETLVPALTDIGELSETYFRELRTIKEGITTVRTDIEKKCNELIYSPSMEKVLQEKIYSTRNERYVLLVKTSMKHMVRGNALDVSSSGATIFMEPETLQPLNNRLGALMLELQMEIARIVRDLSRLIGRYVHELGHNLFLLSGLDFHSAAARFSIVLRGSEPQVPDEPVIRLYDARHPLLYLMSPETTITNDIDLGVEYNGLIISGANTGGKTVLLKTVGLCVLMLMHGLHIPAGPDSVVGIFSSIMADIGDDQSIAHSLSSFSGQIVALRDMLANAGPSSLVLIDEIVVGTNPRQGAALAQAYLEMLIETGARFMVSTHYAELKELAGTNPLVKNASVSFDLETLSPTYRLTTGIPGVSYAFEIARSYGMSEKVIARSTDLLDSRELSVEALIETMQRYEQEMQEERSRLEQSREEMVREKARLREKEARLEQRLEDLKNERGLDFLDELRRHRERISEKMKEIQTVDMKTAGRLQHEINEIEQNLHISLKKGRRKRFSRNYIPVGDGTVVPGDRVFVLPLEKEATVEGIDERGKTVDVLLGTSIRSRFPFDEILVRSSGTDEKTTAGKKHPSPAAPKSAPSPKESEEGLAIQTSYNTVDLRGMRVDDALIKMDADFDRMVRSSILTAVVIHGHGTGAMREAVRATLASSSYVERFRPGKYGEGGDGVTIVYLYE